MSDKMTGAQGPAAPGAIETKDDLINGALVNTGELSDGVLDQVAGGDKVAGTRTKSTVGELQILKVVDKSSAVLF